VISNARYRSPGDLQKKRGTQTYPKLMGKALAFEHHQLPQVGQTLNVYLCVYIYMYMHIILLQYQIYCTTYTQQNPNETCTQQYTVYNYAYMYIYI
jgi:hypothetical protein